MRAVRFDLATPGAFALGSYGSALALDSTPALVRVLVHDGWNEFLPAEELFAEEALRSFDGAPLTVGHPEGGVDMANVRSVTVGYARRDARRDGDRVRVTLVVTDAATAEAVRRGELVELSVGWQVREDRSPGSWGGQRYQIVRRDVRVNHIALLPEGMARAGHEARLR